MTRLLCFTLLFALAAPLCAQEEPVAGLSLPRDPALLTRQREHIINELQQIQRMRGIVNPSDTQLIESLDAQQADWTKQLRDLTQQMQAGPQFQPKESGMLPESMIPLTGRGMPAMPTREPDVALPQDQRFQPPMMPGAMPNPQMPVMPPQIPYSAFGDVGSSQNWYGPDRGETNYWGPKLPKELTEVKQSVESLKREIAELKETIKVLETQIQLLNRNILLSEKVKENGN